MIERRTNSIQYKKGWMALVVVLALALASPCVAFGSNKKKNQEAPKKVSVLEKIDISKIVWPEPPNITRIRYLNYFAGEKLPDFNAKAAKSKSSWMDRLAGTETDKGDDPLKHHFFMGEPHGLAVDSKGNLYVADAKVGAIFVVNPETHDTQMIENGRDASFALIVGMAIDDGDRLFVADSLAHRILVFNPQHKVEAIIREGLADPAGLAIDNENRFLYVADVGLDQVLVYDADNFKLLRKIGTPGTKHASAAPGDFSKPTGVAVDSEGNLYVADFLNARIEIFDADGKFIRTFGKRGDGPGYFSMPKGIAIDCDGHIWVTDAMQNRVQVYSQEGQLLIYMGNVQGILPGMFSGLQYITIDKHNRVFTSEVFPGRVQMFRYVTQDEAKQEYDRRQAEKNKAENKSGDTKAAPAGQPSTSPASDKPSEDKQKSEGEVAKAKGSAAK